MKRWQAPYCVHIGHVLQGKNGTHETDIGSFLCQSSGDSFPQCPLVFANAVDGMISKRRLVFGCVELCRTPVELVRTNNLVVF